MENHNKIKYFLYARKSTESEDRQVASIGAQIEELLKVAKQEGLIIVKTFSESKSAKAPGRPIITKDEWDAVQVILEDKSIPRLKTHSFVFGSELIRCGECGSTIVAYERIKNKKMEISTDMFIIDAPKEKTANLVNRREIFEKKNYCVKLLSFLIASKYQQNFATGP